MKYLVNIDLNKNQLLQAVVEVLATPPLTPSEGQIYYNSVDETLYVRLSSTWLDLGKQPDNLGTDGDKGDVTVGGTGTTLTIDVDAVTYAKMQNVVTANTLLGSTTADGVVTELNAADILTIINVEAGADVTDATNVEAAGAVMESDTSTISMSFVIDEDNMISDSATKVPTQQSVKAYVASQIASAKAYQGGYDASTDTPNLDTTPISGITSGDIYDVTVAGVFYTIDVEVGDSLIATVDSPAVASDWTIVQTNLTAASIKSQYESNPNTNAYTDVEKAQAALQTGTNTNDEVQATTTLAGIAEIATQAEVDAGVDTTKIVTPSTLDTKITDAITATKFSVNIGDGQATSFAIPNSTHTLGTSGDFLVEVRERISGILVVADIALNDVTGTVTASFNVAPTASQYRIIIKS